MPWSIFGWAVGLAVLIFTSAFLEWLNGDGGDKDFERAFMRVFVKDLPRDFDDANGFYPWAALPFGAAAWIAAQWHYSTHITVECTDLCENITACCKPVSYGRDLPSIFGIAVGNFIGAFKALSLLATAGSRHAISNLEEGFSS